jgi:hypothetical protein
VRDVLAGQRDSLSGLRVAALPGRAKMQRKAAKASSTSFAGRCFCLAEMISMSSDFVIIDPWASLDMLKRASAALPAALRL